MKAKLILLLCCLAATSCATRSDPTFMNNASASINGGWVDAGSGQRMMSPGIQTPSVHPFFGTPVAHRAR